MDNVSLKTYEVRSLIKKFHKNNTYKLILILDLIQNNN